MTTCQQCGACCAHFRVSFYWAEAQALGLPDESTRQLGKLLACLAGTDQPQPRCHLLQGEVGREVTCTRYEQRPSPCRELQPGDEKCNRARAAHGLPLLLAPELTLDHDQMTGAGAAHQPQVHVAIERHEDAAVLDGQGEQIGIGDLP